MKQQEKQSGKQPKDIVLSVEDLAVEFDTQGGTVQAVRGVSFSVKQGETIAIVGESGCGKSVTLQAVMGLVPMPPGRIVSGSAKLSGRELIGLSGKALNRERGVHIAMIFQDPMTSLNPTMKIGDQIAETLIVHRGMSRAAARSEAVRLLDRTRISEAHQRSKQYPFEFSGGMLQRVMIALSLACNPEVLIADEPTTALDVTIQNQVLSLMREIQKDTGMAIVLITHDLGVVAQMAQRVVVMYAGQLVETGSSEQIFYESAHPYTTGLRKALPDGKADKRLTAIEGSPPDLFCPPKGCAYFARCPHAMKVCEHHDPGLLELGDAHHSRCWLQSEGAPAIQGLAQRRYSE